MEHVPLLQCSSIASVVLPLWTFGCMLEHVPLLQCSYIWLPVASTWAWLQRDVDALDTYLVYGTQPPPDTCDKGEENDLEKLYCKVIHGRQLSAASLYALCYCDRHNTPPLFLFWPQQPFEAMRQCRFVDDLETQCRSGHYTYQL